MVTLADEPVWDTSEFVPPREIAPDDAIFFLHIPKTGGTSLRAIIERNFSLGDVIQSSFWRFALGQPKALFDTREFISGRVVCGHVPLSSTRHFARPVHVVTFLREPIDLICSHFYYLQKIGIIPATTTIDSIIGSHMEKFFFNTMTRWVAGKFEPDFSVDCITEMQPEMRDPLLLQQALTNLDKIRFVGIVEKFQTSVAKMCATFSWPVPETMPKLNTGRSHSDITNQTRQMLLPLVEFDMQLYRAALNRLEREREAIPANRQDMRPPLAHVIDVCGEGIRLLVRGWYDPEYSPGLGTWRWTGPTKEFSVIAPTFGSSPSTVVINTTAHVEAKVLREVLLMNKDTFIKPTVTVFENGFTLHFAVPPLEEGIFTDRTVLTFRVPEMLIPKNGDSRKLGISVKYISIAREGGAVA